MGAAIAVAVLHVVAIIALIRAFTPEFTDAAVRTVTEAFTVTITPPPPPSPSPTPTPSAAAAAGASGEAGRKSVPKEAAAPKPRIAISTVAAPSVAGTGSADNAGARDTGAGTGAGGPGNGTGSGSGGSGQGGGGAAAPVKISGDINSARDFPRASRDLRIGDHVVVMLTVGTDGRVSACRIHRPSRDPEADRITCRLATQRFRFRPATDTAGNPVAGVYGWQQRWFDPRISSGKQTGDSANAPAEERN